FRRVLFRSQLYHNGRRVSIPRLQFQRGTHSTMAIDVEQQRLNLEHYEWFFRAEAIRKLEIAKAEEAVEDIATRLTTDESLYVRVAAARALGKSRSSKAVDAQIQRMNDEAIHFRTA